MSYFAKDQKLTWAAFCFFATADRRVEAETEEEDGRALMGHAAVFALPEDSSGIETGRMGFLEHVAGRMAQEQNGGRDG
jgi:hypothetical protein